jgi:glycosyltransferase involved in cell wall biosynthesis
MACGCPVVSTDCPSGPSEILEKGKYGLLSPVGDYMQLAENIMKTLNDPLSSEMLAKRALEFTVEKAVDKYIGVIEKLSRNKS